MLRRRVLSAGLAVAALATALAPAAARAEPPPPPKYGDCFNYGARGLVEVSSPGPKVPCSGLHSAEAFKIARWTATRSPFGMSDEERLVIAERKCAPGKDTAFGVKWFNYWAYFMPTREQWDAGQRWLRCDALHAESEDPIRLIRWRGARLPR
ncbi:MAG: septum formation family protein [bacterium]